MLRDVSGTQRITATEGSNITVPQARHHLRRGRKHHFTFFIVIGIIFIILHFFVYQRQKSTMRVSVSSIF